MAKEKKERQPKGVFNSGFASAYSIRNLLDECNHYSKMSKVMIDESGGMISKPNLVALDMWRSSINSVYREIYPKLSPKDIEYIKKIYKSFKSISLIKTMKTEDGIKKIINSNAFHKKTKLLSLVEVKLRKMADVRDLLIPDKQSGIDETPSEW